MREVVPKRGLQTFLGKRPGRRVCYDDNKHDNNHNYPEYNDYDDND